jgi:tripartite-type tricarboxylate transporter receptor subunit TctC
MKKLFAPTMLKRHLGAIGMAVFALAGSGAAAAADPFPTKPVRIMVNTVPGGLTDVVTRLVAERMSEKLGQQVIVENRAGADGLVGIRAVKAAPGDGYTLLGAAWTIAIQPSVKQDPGYDLLQDFAPFGPLVRSALVVVVGPGQPDKTLGEFVARAKANPNKLSYASAGVGTTTHVGAALFLQQSGLNLLHVPYKGNAAAMPDVMSGRVDMIFEAFGSGASKLKAGTLRGLAVTSTRRLPALPQLPTVAEQGFPNFSYYLWLGLFAPGSAMRAPNPCRLPLRSSPSS